MKPRLVVVGAFAGALAAASIPLVVALIFTCAPEVALMAAVASAVLGCYGGAEVGAIAGQ